MNDSLYIRGAREHNLKNVSVTLPKNKLIVFTGLSGSGKSSLAFDTIYAEGQRRYVESLSSYARQFLGIMDKPDVDSIEGLSPAISIDQKSVSHNPRSTVGTVTEIYDYLRLLFARIGHPHCPKCGREISQQSAQQIVDGLMNLAEAKLAEGEKQVRLLILAPVVQDRKGEFSDLLDTLRARGFTKNRIDRHMYDLADDVVLIKTNKHSIDVVLDRLTFDSKLVKDGVSRSNIQSRLTDAVEQALKLSDGLVVGSQVKDKAFEFPDKPKTMEDHLFSEKFACPVCNISLPEIEPRTFSFNSPHGACPTCTGIGTLQKVDPEVVLNLKLTISEGGLLPFSSIFIHDTWFSRLMKEVCAQLGIDMRSPLSNTTKEQRKQLLFGTGDQIYSVRGTNRDGRMTTIHEPFMGVVGELEKRYQETESVFVRGEIEEYMREELCPLCLGARLKKESLGITIWEKSIMDVTDMAIQKTLEWIESLQTTTNELSKREQIISQSIIKEIRSRLGFLLSVGLDYLTLGRTAATLSGGEAQRIRLASQIGSGLSGVLYVLDEPSIGLHQRDNGRLINTLKTLRDLGNTVIVVEHDRETMEHADVIVDFGPGAGEHGGKVTAQGSVDEIKHDPNSLTGKYLSGKKKIDVCDEEPLPHTSTNALESNGHAIKIKRASQFNLKHIDVDFPLGKFICVTGVSGSGKSTLVVQSLYHALALHVNPYHREKPGAFASIEGLEYVDKVILIDQSPIGRTPRSNPATYTGAFTFIRDLFAATGEARGRGYKAGRFSFNVKGGRCEVCEGEGQIKIEMQFLPDVYVDCETCGGKRYNRETLEVHFKGKNIAQVLDMTIEEGEEFFRHIPSLSGKLSTLNEVGLSYMHLGQPAPTLSGGEAQRVKLATELSKKATGRTVYILDEPTTGLHFADLEKLIRVLKRLVQKGNTVIVIEHNLDLIAHADWIIDLGPEGGDKGGMVVAAGKVKDIVDNPLSYTGKYLKNTVR